MNALPILPSSPPEETPDQKAARKRREADAQRVSDGIDKEIELERAEMVKKYRQGIVKVLLLGQPESGKSATLKNFKMKFAPTAWEQERASWKPVIQLNLIRSIITITEILQAEMGSRSLSPSSSTPQSLVPDNAHTPASPLSLDTTTSPAPPTDEAPLHADKHQLLRLRLDALRRVEESLNRRLGVTPPKGIHSPPSSPGDEYAAPGVRRHGEFGVRGWNSVFENTDQRFTVSSGSGDGDGDEGEDKDGDEATDIIANCREDVMALWADDAVRAALKARKMKLEDSASFFLGELERIATRNYKPSDSDILRAKFPGRAPAIQEHKIQIENQTRLVHDSKEWIFYGVEGMQTKRHVWERYLDGVNAIIFFASISCFDEHLPEDPCVNKLENSMTLWHAVCSSQLLSQTCIILFLSKRDLLERKLKAGARIRDYLPSYGDRPNEAAAVIGYLMGKFRDIMRQCSPKPRDHYAYISPDPCIDPKAAVVTLEAVQDSILRKHLEPARSRRNR
ncbi:guanine nucleotide binding protein, alpha subunit [Infundibulicybe gibba]|nr:guanine nucleotide binding protein, alpha subunit [Infundibulicybe gibba]